MYGSEGWYRTAKIMRNTLNARSKGVESMLNDLAA